MMYVGHFECRDPRVGMGHMGCGHQWHAPVGPATCPKCGMKDDYHPYVTWKNYPEEKELWCSICSKGFVVK